MLRHFVGMEGEKDDDMSVGQRYYEDDGRVFFPSFLSSCVVFLLLVRKKQRVIRKSFSFSGHLQSIKCPLNDD